MVGKYENVEMQPVLAQDINEEGYGGCTEANENENRYWLYYGWFETTATAEQILALAEDEDVMSIYPGVASYYEADYFVTTIKGDEVASELVKRAE